MSREPPRRPSIAECLFADGLPNSDAIYEVLDEVEAKVACGALDNEALDVGLRVIQSAAPEDRELLLGWLTALAESSTPSQQRAEAVEMLYQVREQVWDV